MLKALGIVIRQILHEVDARSGGKIDPVEHWPGWSRGCRARHNRSVRVRAAVR